jgi:hypothetical protein
MLTERFSRSLISLSFVSGLLLASSASGQTVTNGNFNTLGAGDPDYFATWVEYIYPIGNPLDCETNGNSRVTANTDGVGDYSLVIRAQPPVGCFSGVSQTMGGLTAGTSYQFNFFAMYVPPTDPNATNNLTFKYNGLTIFSQQINNTGSFSAYSTASFVAVANGLLEVEGFTSASAGQVRVDDITIVTPEPASVLLVGAGLAGLFATARRRRSA